MRLSKPQLRCDRRVRRWGATASGRVKRLTQGWPIDSEATGVLHGSPGPRAVVVPDLQLGDGGSAGDPENRSQNLNSLLGKILRIEVNEDSYSTPLDNPFKNRKDAKNEIWHY